MFCPSTLGTALRLVESNPAGVGLVTSPDEENKEGKTKVASTTNRKYWYEKGLFTVQPSLHFSKIANIR